MNDTWSNQTAKQYSFDSERDSGLEQANENRKRAWERALRARNAQACHYLAAQAGSDRNAEAVPFLLQLVETPADWRLKLRGQGKAWRWARVAGINALACIGSKDAIAAIAAALFDSDPHVRETAAYELPTFGPDVVPTLRYALRSAPDWTLSGMQAGIRILGRMGDNKASEELTQILAEQLPGDPARWARQTFVRPFGLVSGVFLSLWTLALFTGSPDPSISLVESALETGVSVFIGGFVPFLFLYMLLVCLVFLPLLNLCAARERGSLACSAVEALAGLNAKEALPLVIDIAFGPRPHLARCARVTLRRLLPLLAPDDAKSFPSHSRQRLAQALGMTDTATDLALLDALAQVGTGQAVKAVERQSVQAVSGDVRERALGLLPILRARQQSEMASASLLRACQSSLGRQEEMLRATEQPPSAPAEQLLRPTQAGQSRILFND